MKIPKLDKDVKHILVFGAVAHVGGALAKFIAQTTPDIELTLATS